MSTERYWTTGRHVPFDGSDNCLHYTDRNVYPAQGNDRYRNPLQPPRLRTITVSLLRPGMLIHDLQAGWLSHEFRRRRFVIEDQQMITRLSNEGIGEVVIDVANGLDIDPAMLKGARTIEANTCESKEEAHREASSLQHEAMQTVHRLLSDARFGHQIDIQRAEPMIEKMMHLVLHHHDALHPLLQLKRHDLYSYQHSISVAAMAVALGTTLGFDQETLRQTALGVLLQDIGKVRIPNHILAKPGRLDADETNVVRRHVLESQIILDDTPAQLN